MVGDPWNVVADSYLAFSKMACAQGQCLHKMFIRSLQYHGPHVSSLTVEIRLIALRTITGAAFGGAVMFAAL